MSASASKESMQFAIKENVLCFHGPLIYEAQILEAEVWDEKTTTTGMLGPHYCVHYKGWKKSWDEWAPESRILKDNKSSREKQQQLILQAKAARAAAKTSSAKDKESSTKQSSRGSPAPGSVVGVGGAGGAKGKGKEKMGGKKRSRADAFDTEESYLKRPEVKIPIPDVLRVKLVDDWEAVTKNSQLVTLPRNPNVKQVVEEYKEYHRKKRGDKKLTRADALLEEVLSGLLVYFDKCLGNNLLYRFERAQYVKIRRETRDEKGMSEIYGVEHLLRLFVNLPSFIAHTSMDTESVNLLRDHLTEFMKWIIKELDRLFQKEYENTTLEYQNMARA